MATTPIQDACRKVSSIQSDYVAEYEFDDGEHQTHYPTDFETLMIEDAIIGLLANEDFVAAFIEWMLLVHGEKHNEPECPICAAISTVDYKQRFDKAVLMYGKATNQRDELLGIARSVEAALAQGFLASEVLDENSPLRDALRVAIAQAESR